MNLFESDLQHLIALLWHAMPDASRWSGPAAAECQSQVESLIHLAQALR
jgi:hypothetical protein